MSIQYPKIKAYNSDLLLNIDETLVDIDASAGVSSLTVKSIVGFGVGDYVLLGEFGQEDAEIIRVSTGVAPSGSTITLNSATVFPHERSTKVYRLDRNQVEFSRSTTLTGSKSVLSTVDINAQSLYTVYEDTTNTTGYGWYRYSNSADSTFTGYSESYPYAGYSDSSLKAIFDDALMSIGLVNDEGVPTFTRAVTRQAALQAAKSCQSELAGLRQKWSYLTQFNYLVDEIETGQDTYALPTDVKQQDGDASILAARIASERDLRYIDKQKLNWMRENIVKTTLGAAISATSDVTITLTDSSDFDDSGSIDVPNDDFSVFDAITYTANNRTTNVLSGVTGITATHINGSVVWQGADYGQPTRFTVFEGNIVLETIPSADWHGRNLYIDCYVNPTLVDDLADEPEFPAYVIKPYVAAKLAEILDNGPSTRSDKLKSEYKEKVQVLLSKEVNGQVTSVKPLRTPNVTSNFGRLGVIDTDDSSN